MNQFHKKGDVVCFDGPIGNMPLIWPFKKISLLQAGELYRKVTVPTCNWLSVRRFNGMYRETNECP